MTLFGCNIADADIVRACAPEQPDEVKVGQEWMSVETGSILPVKMIRGDYVDLGVEGGSYTAVVTEPQLREQFVCVEPPDNVEIL